MRNNIGAAGRSGWQDYFRISTGVLALILGVIVLTRTIVFAMEGTVLIPTMLVGAGLVGFAVFRLKVVWQALGRRS